MVYDYLALRSIKGIADQFIAKILEKRKTLKGIFDISYEEFYNLEIPDVIAKKIIAKDFDEKFIDNEIGLCKHEGIDIITIEDKRYPSLLKNTVGAPCVIYVRGSLDCLNEPTIAIVGSRKCSKQSSDFTFKLAKDLAGVGFTVVSGYAFGIDIVAHLGAMSNGATVGVLGSGLLNIYPTQHEKYVEKLLEKGCLISEFSLKEEPFPGNFPRRNRIISGLCLGTIVIEASERSGSLITARFALEQNREVFAVPNFPTNFHSATNRLIKEGAKLTESYLDIVQEFAYLLKGHVKEGQKEKEPEFESEIEKNIYDMLKVEPLTIDEICARLKVSIIEIISPLTQMELENIVLKNENEKYAIYKN